MFCTNCGVKNQNNNKFCRSCGNKLLSLQEDIKTFSYKVYKEYDILSLKEHTMKF